MSMKKWTDEELISTRDKLEEWKIRYKKAGNKLWHFTAFLGALSASTGIAFIFFDGVDVFNVLLIIMGSLTCLAWYQSEKRRQNNLNFLDEIHKELARREKIAAKSKTKHGNDEKNKKQHNTDQNTSVEEETDNSNETNTSNSKS